MSIVVYWLTQGRPSVELFNDDQLLAALAFSEAKRKEKDADAALKITNRCFEKGALMISFAGSVLRFQPPLVITYDELDRALDIIEECMEELQAGKLDGYDVSGQGW